MPRAHERADRYGLRRDPESGTPYYAFEDSTGWRQGWFEDAESLGAKYSFVRARGLGGVVIFPLAYGDEELWADLREAFRLPRE
jgi:spore germination protein YaaH